MFALELTPESSTSWVITYLIPFLSATTGAWVVYWMWQLLKRLRSVKGAFWPIFWLSVFTLRTGLSAIAWPVRSMIGRSWFDVGVQRFGWLGWFALGTGLALGLKHMDLARAKRLAREAVRSQKMKVIIDKADEVAAKVANGNGR